jgi:hypothetical protein
MYYVKYAKKKKINKKKIKIKIKKYINVYACAYVLLRNYYKYKRI